MTKKYFSDEQSREILDIASTFAEELLNNPVTSHGVLIDANFIIKEDEHGYPNGIHILDNETIAISRFPHGYDEGTAVFRSIINKTANPSPEIDLQNMKAFLDAYNDVADTAMSLEELATSVNQYNANAILIGYAAFSRQEEIGTSHDELITIFGGFALDTSSRIKNAMEYNASEIYLESQRQWSSIYR